jgi:tight adherence protein C
MSAIEHAPAAISIALAIAAFTLLCVRTWMQHRDIVPDADTLPLGLRVSRGPALLLVPVVTTLMPMAKEGRMLQVLDANGLVPPVTPDLWVAMRLVHGIAAAGLTIILAGAGHWSVAALAAVSGFMAGGLWLRGVNSRRERQIARELPAYLDLLTVCVEAGATLTAGVRLIVAQAPESPLRSYFDRVLREVRGGRPRAQAFTHVAQVHGVESLTTLASALAHAEGAGMSLGQILRTQSEQRTAERFARAERLAMQAPVKMLGPLIFCIFPCTFIVLAVPIVVRMLEVFRS